MFLQLNYTVFNANISVAFGTKLILQFFIFDTADHLSCVPELSRMSPKVLDKLILMSRGCNSLRDIADIMNAHVSSAAEIVPAEEVLKMVWQRRRSISTSTCTVEEDVEKGLAGVPLSATTAI